MRCSRRGAAGSTGRLSTWAGRQPRTVVRLHAAGRHARDHRTRGSAVPGHRSERVGAVRSPGRARSGARRGPRSRPGRGRDRNGRRRRTSPRGAPAGDRRIRRARALRPSGAPRGAPRSHRAHRRGAGTRPHLCTRRVGTDRGAGRRRALLSVDRLAGPGRGAVDGTAQYPDGLGDRLQRQDHHGPPDRGLCPGQGLDGRLQLHRRRLDRGRGAGDG